MFLRLYQYSILLTVRQKLIMFWSLIFPIILGTLFHAAFGGYVEETVSFHQIPVAYVQEEGAEEAFAQVLESLEESELIKIIPADGAKARELLQEEKAEGIFYNKEGNEITLTVAKRQMNQSILSTILEQYQRANKTLETIGRENPSGILAAVEVIKQRNQYLKEGAISDTPQNMITDSFYALVAMNCLMGVSMGLQIAVGFKANLSALASRRVTAGSSQIKIMLPDLAAKITIQFLCAVFSVCVLRYAMNVPMGNKFALVVLTVLVGCVVGIFLGFFVGGIGTWKESTKEGICICFMLFSSFLGGLMVPGMYRFLENHMPIVNRINPASLIVKALYSLNIYEGYEKYAQCMASLLAIAVLLGTAAFAMTRRERYASI